MRLNIVILCSVLASSASALSVPPQPNLSQVGHTHGFARRNGTAALTTSLQFNINPDINGPECDGVYEANINVEYSPDNFFLTSGCENALEYIGGGGTNNKGSKDVNVIFMCLGQTVASLAGSGDRSIKVIFNIPSSSVVNGANLQTQLVSSTLELVNEQDNTFITTLVNLGFKMSGTVPVFDSIYCI